MSHFSDITGESRVHVASTVSDIYWSEEIEVLEVSDRLFLEGLQMYASYRDKQWSHVDCMSFAVMRRRGITDALAHDDHFRQAGFTTLIT